MTDFRNYNDLIRNTVARINERDQNWKWSVKSISKLQVKIRWEYLDDEKNNCFVMKAENDATGNGVGDWIYSNRHNGSCIDAFMVAEEPNPAIGAETSIECGIIDALNEIEHCAHSEY